MTHGINVESDEFSSDQIILNEAGTIYGVQQNTDGAADCEVVLHDGPSPNVKYHFTCKGADLSYGATSLGPIQCRTSIRLVITGAGASCVVQYEKAAYWVGN